MSSFSWAILLEQISVSFSLRLDFLYSIIKEKRIIYFLILSLNFLEVSENLLKVYQKCTIYKLQYFIIVLTIHRILLWNVIKKFFIQIKIFMLDITLTNLASIMIFNEQSL